MKQTGASVRGCWTTFFEKIIKAGARLSETEARALRKGTRYATLNARQLPDCMMRKATSTHASQHRGSTSETLALWGYKWV